MLHTINVGIVGCWASLGPLEEECTFEDTKHRELQVRTAIIARIEHYLKVVKSRDCSVLRLAIADLFKADVTESYAGQYLQVRRPITNTSRRSYPGIVDDISKKLVMGDATKGKEQFTQNLWRFMAYSNTYVKRDPNLASCATTNEFNNNCEKRSPTLRQSCKI